jgi:hypothetical protein
VWFGIGSPEWKGLGDKEFFKVENIFTNFLDTHRGRRFTKNLKSKIS